MASKKTTPPATESSAAPAPATRAAKKAAAKNAPAKKAASKKAAPEAQPTTAADQAPSSPAPSLEQIAHAAYLNFRSRQEQGLHGDAVGDWLDAESKLRSKPKRK